MKTKPFKELREKMTLEQQAESEMQANVRNAIQILGNPIRELGDRAKIDLYS